MKSEYIAVHLASIDRARQVEAESRNMIRLHLASLRVQAGVTQRQLANALGWKSAAYISELESGTRQWTREAVIAAVEFLRGAMK